MSTSTRTRAWRLAATAAAAAIAVATAVTVSSSSGGDPPPERRISSAPAERLAGIPERRGVLGDPGAPLTITEFVDLQCPVCAMATRETLPVLIDEYVRTGRARLEVRILSFLGPDSVTAARFADGATRQDRLWAFLETFYAAQGVENSGYVTPAFLRSVAGAAGVDPAKAARHAPSAAAAQALNDANAEAERLGVSATPTFALTGRDGSTEVFRADQIVAAVERAARR